MILISCVILPGLVVLERISLTLFGWFQLIFWMLLTRLNLKTSSASVALRMKDAVIYLIVPG